MAERTATPPAKGGVRDALIAAAVAGVGGLVMSRTASPDLAAISQDFTNDFLYLGVGVGMGLVTYIRKLAMERLRSQ